jgi:hypothetical protein
MFNLSPLESTVFPVFNSIFDITIFSEDKFSIKPIYSSDDSVLVSYFLLP